MNGWTGRSLREIAHEARRALGIDDLILAVHDASFPGDPGEDTGRGTPYSKAAHRLCAFADGLGFTGLQLGPQGVTTHVNRSPYDSTVFSRNPLSISLASLHEDPAWEGLLDRAALEAATGHGSLGERGRPRVDDDGASAGAGRVQHDHAEEAHARALDEAFRRFEQASSPALRARFDAFRREAAGWLDHDVAFEARAAEYGSDDMARWPVAAPLEDLTLQELRPASRRCAERYAFAQFVVHAQHAAFRDDMHRLGWKVLGDLQVGLSPRDRWRRAHLFLESYALGAPPSRTDPQGQPWGYAVLRPESSEALAFFRARIRKMAGEYDGVRIDHPHGLVCPWVYGSTSPDSLLAVARGARLFESPDLPDHLDLARYAIARPDQIDRREPRHGDHWVRSLDEGQVERYAERFGIIVEELAAQEARSGRRSDVVCEVLSTAPYPLVEVLRRHGFGRFRVTQKADLDRPSDGYRSENASPRDWIMVGTHDTPPLVRVVDGWFASGVANRRAEYLAERLTPDGRPRAELAAAIGGTPAALVEAMFADLFASPARHALVFMSDFFGFRDVYNRPGIVDGDNWGLRIPADFEREYRRGLAAGSAMDVTGAMVMALRARARTTPAYVGLADELDHARRAQQAAPEHDRRNP
jgi:4-alpha-glucanotransferase